MNWIILKKKLLEAFKKLKKIQPQSIRSNHLEFLEYFIEFIIKLDDNEMSQIIDNSFFMDIMNNVPDYIESLIHYFHDISSKNEQKILNYYLQTIGSLEVTILMTIKEDCIQLVKKYGNPKSNLIYMNDYLRRFFNDPFLVIDSITEESIKIKFRTDIGHAIIPFCSEKYKEAVGQFKFIEIERYNYPFKLLQQNRASAINKYISFNLEERMKFKYIDKIMAFGIGSEVSSLIYKSMDKGLLNYYSICDVLLNYLRNISNIEYMAKEEFYNVLDLKKNIIKMIDKFLDSFNYSTPYSWFYFHVLTLRDKMTLTYLNDLIFIDDINETDISFDEKKIRLFTIKSDVKFDLLLKTLKEKLLTNEDKQLWYHGTSRASADRILNLGIDTKYCSENHDFGIKSAFYLGEDFELAIKWALKKNNVKINDYGAVLIFKTDSINKINGTSKNIPERNENWKLWDLLNDDTEWKNYVKLSRNNDKKNLEKDFPRADDYRSVDLIYGPIATNIKKIDHSEDMQLAFKSPDSCDIFGEQFIEAVIVFEGKISFK